MTEQSPSSARRPTYYHHDPNDPEFTDRRVMPKDIVNQRANGWPDFGPETYCHDCGNRNILSWFVASPLWNVAYPDDSMREIIRCPQCFTDAYEANTGRLVTWQLSVDGETLGDADLVTAVLDAADADERAHQHSGCALCEAVRALRAARPEGNS